jgi:hypothetical protein
MRLWKGVTETASPVPEPRPSMPQVHYMRVRTRKHTPAPEAAVAGLRRQSEHGAATLSDAHRLKVRARGPRLLVWRELRTEGLDVVEELRAERGHSRTG